MTRDEAIDIVRNFEFIKAFAAGADIEYNPMPSKNPAWWIVEDPNFDNAKECYRIKPKPKKVPMAYEDFKGFPVVWFKVSLDYLSESLIIQFDKNNFHTNCRSISYGEANHLGYKWSTDRVNWHKFEKEI